MATPPADGFGAGLVELAQTVGAIGVNAAVFAGALAGPVGVAVGAAVGIVGAMVNGYMKGDIGSSTPIGAMKQDGTRAGGIVPAPASQVAAYFGLTVSKFNSLMKTYGVVPSRSGKWGKASTTSGIKVFGSDGLLGAWRWRDKPLRAFLAAYSGVMSVNDRRSVALFVDGFINGGGSATSGGGIARPDGCTDDFYQDLRAAIGLNSNRFASLRQVCLKAGFRGITCWGKTLNHRSAVSLPNALQPQNRTQLRQAVDAVFEFISVIPGASAGATAEWLARRSRVRNINLQNLAWLIVAAMQLILKRIRSRQLADRMRQEVQRKHGVTTAVGEAFAALGEVMLGTQMQDLAMQGFAEQILDTFRDENVKVSDDVYEALQYAVDNNQRDQIIAHYQTIVQTRIDFTDGLIRPIQILMRGTNRNTWQVVVID
jgi:hypothetical protein